MSKTTLAIRLPIPAVGDTYEMYDALPDCKTCDISEMYYLAYSEYADSWRITPFQDSAPVYIEYRDGFWREIVENEKDGYVNVYC